MAEPIASDLLPEDAYDGGDPISDRVAVIERAVASWRIDSDSESKRIRQQPLLSALATLAEDRESKPFIKLLSKLKAQMEEGN
jgi:hypothetical protein